MSPPTSRSGGQAGGQVRVQADVGAGVPATVPSMPRSVRLVAWSFFLANVAAVTWPGLTFFNRVEPMILGFPFIMVWLTGWLVASLVVLAWIEHKLHGATAGIEGRPNSLANEVAEDGARDGADRGSADGAGD